MNLYDIGEQYRQVLDLASNSEDMASFGDTLAALQGEAREKALRCAYVIESLGMKIKLIQDEQKRLSRRHKTIEANIIRLNQYVMAGMKAAGLVKVEDALFTVSIQPNPQSVEIAAGTVIPLEYRRVIPETYEPYKTAIKEALARGEVIEGCKLTRTEGLRIR